MIETKDLEAKMEGLTGLDYEEVEREEREAGNSAADVTFSKSFMIRLAARALGVNPYDLKDLSVKEYVGITTRVSNFLFADLAEEMRLQRSEKRQ